MKEKTFINITNVSKNFDKKTIINNISFNVNQGEIVCLLGPSGAGKTTLIRLITGALKADSGKIEIGGVQVPSMSLYAKMGFMPQSDALYTDLSGFDNLLFFGNQYKIKSDILKQEAIEILTSLDLLDDKDKLVSKYSGGMRKRLSLAIALLHKPTFLLLDEPTVGIDPILRKAIWEQFYSLRSDGITIIISTHVMDEAIKCDRTALIYEGTLVAFDLTEKLIEQTSSGNIEELFFMAKEGQL